MLESLELLSGMQFRIIWQINFAHFCDSPVKVSIESARKWHTSSKSYSANLKVETEQTYLEGSVSCLLCANTTKNVVETFTGKELRRLWKELNREFTPEAWGGVVDGYTVAMYSCNRCGFEFFEPTLAGNEAFYRQLEGPDYFSTTRPEFARTLDFAERKGIKNVLDVGCGAGAFLDLARDKGLRTYGLELNGVAAARARAKGHSIFEQLLHELDPARISNFDLITFFQVLEHVANPITVLKEGRTLLSSGGYIAVAVPSSEGVYRLAPWDPHQWPPHHISRWRLIDFQQLALAAELRLVECGGDVLLGSAIEHLWKLNNRLSTALNRPPRFGGGLAPKLISFLYRKTGMKHFFPHWGNSIYAYFKRI
jgi:SAM-dependent methyltransferase